LIEEYAFGRKEILYDELKSIADALAAAQPDMAPLVSLSRRIRQAKAPEELAGIAKRYENSLRSAKEKIPIYLAPLIHAHDKVLTYSGSSTVRDAVIALRAGGLSFEMVVPESAPAYEGKALAADLKRHAVPCTLIPDADMLCQLKECALIIVGADWVGDDFFINKSGTLSLAQEAKRLGKGFYVLCDTTKIVPGAYSPARPFFEKVPLDLATAIITEEGT
jgi:translation initiation factor 2B subunit (eIF-2B alpha/beta/delta family)